MRMRISSLLAIAALGAFALPGRAAPLACPRGEPVAASIGGGAVMRSCVWEKSPGVRVRTGPLELYKDGVLILKTQTNARGQLHGPYQEWTDEGHLQQQGDYVEGRREGDWIETDGKGSTVRVRYRAGVRVSP